MSNAPQVIVVGSGPSGVSAAWPLVRAGIDVLMIDASAGAKPLEREARTLGEFRLDASGWKERFGTDLAGLGASDDVSPKLTTDRARATLDGFASRIGMTSRGMVALGSLASGGLSNIWGALAAPFCDNDFAGYPFDAAALRDSYNAVKRRIGVSGGRGAELDSVSSAPARRLLTRYGQDDAFELQPAPNAVLMQALGDRQPCSLCGLCMFGCSRGSIYDSAAEIPALRRYRNFSYASGHFVRGLHANGADHEIEIEVDGVRRRLQAPIIVLAAGTIATSGLVLRRLRIERPVRLLTNPVAVTAFIMPAFAGRDFAERSFSLGQLFYRLRTGGVRAAGVVYGADALPLDLFAARLPVARPFALRLSHALAPAMLMATCYLPGSFSNNTLRAHEEDDDGRITAEGMQTSEATAALKSALRHLRREFFRLGAFPVPRSSTILQPGADAHYAGTLPMGGTGPVSTSRDGELTNCPGLFVVDGSVLPSLPATHPTLTIMANADRIGRVIAHRLQTQKAADQSIVLPLTA